MLHLFFLRRSMLAFALAAVIGVSAAPRAQGRPDAAAPLVFVGNREYPPFSYLDHGVPNGIDVDIAHALGAVLGREVRVELTDWQTAQDRVLDGDADGLLSMTMSPERALLYDFPDPTVTRDFGLFVRSDHIGIRDLSDLSGARVGVNAAGLPRRVLQIDTSARLVLVDNYREGFERLADGSLDAVAGEIRAGAYLLEHDGLTNIVRAGVPFASVTGGLAIRKNNPALLADLNRGIRTLKANGTIDRILLRWRPKQVVFLTRERMYRLELLVGAGFATLLLTAAAVWLVMLRKQLLARAAQRRTEEKFRLLIENAHDIVFTIDAEGYCQSMNRAGLALTGRTFETSRPTHFREIVVAEHAEIATGMLSRALEGDAVPRFELDVCTAAGKRITLDLDVSAIRDADGRIAGAQGIARDITARKELEAQFRQAQKMEAIGRLAGGVAHDFNNILTVIIGCSELAALQVDPSSRARREIEEIQRAAVSASSLTRQLLIFSRKSTVHPSVFELGGVIRRLQRMLQRLIGEDVSLVVLPAAGDLHIEADMTQVEQVVMNLVVNARDAMPMGGTLTIGAAAAAIDDAFAGAHPGVRPGEFVRLTVADSGIGMTPEVQAQIFVPFFTTKGPSKGTGLGLATVHGIVQQAGGCITVDSAPGHGTIFSIYFPRASAPAVDIAPGAAAVAAQPSNGSILLVEDDDSVRALSARALREHGYEVLTASDAAEAIEIVGHGPSLDLLLTDIVMPGLNGFALAEYLRQLHPDLAVLYASGYADESCAYLDLGGGDANFLQKPYSAEALAREVGRLVQRSTAGRAAGHGEAA